MENYITIASSTQIHTEPNTIQPSSIQADIGELPETAYHGDGCDNEGNFDSMIDYDADILEASRNAQSPATTPDAALTVPASSPRKRS